MTLLLATLAVSFAAFCIWLTVRIANRRERWAKWMLAAVVGVPVLYVASFGPACAMIDCQQLELRTAQDIYRPLESAPDWMHGGLAKYARVCGGEGGEFVGRFIWIIGSNP